MTDDEPIRLAIVGTRKLPEWWRPPAAQGIIDWTLNHYYMRLEMVISGGAPGIDTMAEESAKRMGLPVNVIRPEPRADGKPFVWKDYQARDELIAQDCTHLLAIRWKDADTYGSGWTADRAETLGKVVQRVLL